MDRRGGIGAVSRFVTGLVSAASVAVAVPAVEGAVVS